MFKKEFLRFLYIKQAIYATINHLGMIYMKLKSENIKEDLVFPRCVTVIV